MTVHSSVCVMLLLSSKHLCLRRILTHNLLLCTVTCRQFPNLTFAPRKTCPVLSFHQNSNLTFHRYHATAINSISQHYWYCKTFFLSHCIFFNTILHAKCRKSGIEILGPTLYDKYVVWSEP